MTKQEKIKTKKAIEKLKELRKTLEIERANAHGNNTRQNEINFILQAISDTLANLPQ